MDGLLERPLDQFLGRYIGLPEDHVEGKILGRRRANLGRHDPGTTMH